jgi:2-iminobutanoate/2-iminopropanoate deaminase
VKVVVSSPAAPKAIGPYSPAIRVGQLLFISGQISIDPASGQFVAGDIKAETRRALENIGALLKADGLDYTSVVRITVFLADMNDFAAMNDVYGAFLEEPYPARSTVQAGRLPRDARVEIDVIASH